MPNFYFDKLITNNIADNGKYGRRLINEGQLDLLKKYDLIIFGVFLRGDLTKWYPIGWLESQYILDNYEPTFKRPDGGEYPFKALPIKNSDLKLIRELINNLDC
jgi:hypothetical protein